LRQEPFSYSPARSTSAIGSKWSVPIIARDASGAQARVLLDAETGWLDLGGQSDGAVVVNAGGSGYYRVRYTPEHQRHLSEHLDELDSLERFHLLGDSWATVVASRAQLEDFLLVAEALGKETDPDVWAQVTGALSFVDHALDEDGRGVLAHYTRALLAPVFARVGWDPAPSDDERTPTLRAQLLASLAVVGQDSAVRTEAARRHREWIDAGVALDPDTASAILSAVAAAGDEAAFDTFVDRYRHPATPQEELRYLYALARFADPGLASRAFDMARTEVRTQNAPFLVQQLLAQRDTGAEVWAMVRAHWDDLVARWPATTLPRMVDSVKLLCRDRALAQDVIGFVQAHPIPSGQRTVEQILERLEVNVAFAARLQAGAATSLAEGLRRLERR
jgi:aminopeptidase N